MQFIDDDGGFMPFPASAAGDGAHFPSLEVFLFNLIEEFEHFLFGGLFGDFE